MLGKHVEHAYAKRSLSEILIQAPFIPVCVCVCMCVCVCVLNLVMLFKLLEQ